jgi:hypothetical protein
MERVDFLAGDVGMETVSTNLSYTLGFFSRPDPSFDPYQLAAGECGALRSTEDVNAPFPIGPMRDAGDPLTLVLPSKTVQFARMLDPNPSFGFTYSASGLMTGDWTPGAAQWKSAGGANVGAFTVDGVVPAPFTTMPDVLGMAPVAGDAVNGVTLMVTPAPEAGVRTILEVSWNEVSGNMVTALTQIACRAPDGAATVTIPGKQLAMAPRSTALDLLLIRASVAPIQASGVSDGEAIFGTQQLGTIVVAP